MRQSHRIMHRLSHREASSTVVATNLYGVDFLGYLIVCIGVKLGKRLHFLVHHASISTEFLVKNASFSEKMKKKQKFILFTNHNFCRM